MRAAFSVFCATILLFSVISCSDSETDVLSASATAVFDFEDSESHPKARLAVFFQLGNEAQRSESFTVSNEESGYSWIVSKPGIFTGMNKSYAYSINLSPPEGKEIPVGSYTVTYYDAAENSDEAKFSVNYNKGLLSATSENFREFLPNANENIAIYDDSGELLFMGKEKSSWKTNSGILKDYKLAFSKRLCYVTPGNTVICLMPTENLKETEKTEN